MQLREIEVDVVFEVEHDQIEMGRKAGMSRATWSTLMQKEKWLAF